ncbi:putative flagellar basal-body rod protein flgB (proximal rod protein) [uncultured Pleomorphomonas sp.]|uniref:Flagellar basal body rod protein FlgB n=2 Tax=Pleomorphomonas TaxID=261933 RepID=A0A2G9X1H0_9HYPH|nr:flagellar basal body rod protein FlgB [Pleomorphomonas carboxyditropha]PIP00796.1 flagellar basal body rod protein FlgB [Pleomorphomonas carboxyditropha]SCM72694.1 putative flagellar basal-body rod protein flgB (proximal rod protein) [uncultured Pleomorphomonas sp.]
MSMTDLPVLQALKGKLRFHETRQKVLAENVANAETPGYTARDIKAPDFFRVAVEGEADAGVSTVLTSPMHIAGPAIGNGTPFRPEKVGGYDVTPDGNAVSLEDQMMKVTSNQMDFQTVTSLYQRSLGLLKTAVGKK